MVRSHRLCAAVPQPGHSHRLIPWEQKHGGDGFAALAPLLQALSTSLQGFLHSLVYGWLRQNFWQEVVGKSLSLQHPRGLRAFYDESLGAVP